MREGRIEDHKHKNTSQTQEKQQQSLTQHFVYKPCVIHMLAQYICAVFLHDILPKRSMRRQRRNKLLWPYTVMEVETLINWSEGQAL
jgi:hypothetical protein